MSRYIAFNLSALIVIGLGGCHTNAKLETALDLAGENRPELERVLAHYSQDPVDALKLRAAEFLIENMPGHVSRADTDKVQAYFDEILPIFDLEMTLAERIDTLNGIAGKYPVHAPRYVQDAEVITAEYLIRNIDLSFELWRKPWARHLDFEQFSESILPYKVTELQPLDGWKEELYGRFMSKWDSLPPNDEYGVSAYWIAKHVNNELDQTLKPAYSEDYRGYPMLSSGLIPHISFGGCTEFVTLGTTVLRSKGVPVYIDYVPMWGRNGGAPHYFYSILDHSGKTLPCIWPPTSNPGDYFPPNLSLTKVFRQTYARNETVMDYNRSMGGGINITPFREDVTHLYTNVSDISIKIPRRAVKHDHVHIAVFNRGSWREVDFGRYSGGKAHFKNMGRNHLYIVMDLDRGRLVPLTKPFVLDWTGTIRFVEPGTELEPELRIRRKAQKDVWTAQAESWVVGGKIQASNDPGFSECETVYTIKDAFYPDMLPLDTEKEYRYWRFLGLPLLGGNVSELQFYEHGATDVARGKPIGSSLIARNDPTNVGHAKAFDGDWLTHFEADATDAAPWVGLDMGHPVKMSGVRCVARSDDNGIHFGDLYELSYWGDAEWVSLGEQIADERYLIYRNVPRGAVLWLRNKTRGEMETAFTWENNTQRWW